MPVTRSEIGTQTRSGRDSDEKQNLQVNTVGERLNAA